MEKVKVIEDVTPQKDYFAFSIISFFFCPVFGILAIWKSLKTKSRVKRGDEWYAELSALDALKWAMTAVAIGGAVYFIALLLGIYYLVAFHFGGQPSPFIQFNLPTGVPTTAMPTTTP